MEIIRRASSHQQILLIQPEDPETLNNLAWLLAEQSQEFPGRIQKVLIWPTSSEGGTSCLYLGYFSGGLLKSPSVPKAYEAAKQA